VATIGFVTLAIGNVSPGFDVVLAHPQSGELPPMPKTESRQQPSLTHVRAVG
jgi:hypothetical protein